MSTETAMAIDSRRSATPAGASLKGKVAAVKTELGELKRNCAEPACMLRHVVKRPLRLGRRGRVGAAQSALTVPAVATTCGALPALEAERSAGRTHYRSCPPSPRCARRFRLPCS